ncbi:MAG: hypothetical protein PHV08_06865 [Sulfurovaceae bacterium]|nr:hypothetical protein [Sulfurovaceae bacterium]
MANLFNSLDSEIIVLISDEEDKNNKNIVSFLNGISNKAKNPETSSAQQNGKTQSI